MAVNFYKHHLGDYATATSHLSFIEDAAYSRLIRRYYSSEKPLPRDVKEVSRLVGARSKVEAAAVEAILKEFFDLRADGWHQARCDREIQLANSKAERNREVGKLGGRPPKTETQTVMEIKPKGNHDGYQNEPTVKPQGTQGKPSPDSSNQTPDSRLQNLLSKLTHTSDVSSSVRADPEPEKDSVCGSFTKIGGEVKANASR